MVLQNIDTLTFKNFNCKIFNLGFLYCIIIEFYKLYSEDTLTRTSKQIFILISYLFDPITGNIQNAYKE